MNTDLKKCTKCEKLKEKSDFCNYNRNKDGLNHTCKECVKKYQCENRERIRRVNQQYKRNNKEKIKQYLADNKNAMKEYFKKYNKQYYKDNKDKILKNAKIYKNNNKNKRNARDRSRRKTDIKFKTNHILSKSLYKTFKSKGLSKKKRHWEDLTGWTLEEFKNHIASLFCKKMIDGEGVVMSWDNWGSKWQLDHIYPNDLCDNTEEAIIYNWRLENLQPLWKEDNLEKSNDIGWKKDKSRYLPLCP